MNYMKLVSADRLKDCLLLEGNLGHHCSNCNEQFYEDFFYPRETPCLSSEKYKPFKYCPYCGAKMEEKVYE